MWTAGKSDEATDACSSDNPISGTTACTSWLNPAPLAAVPFSPFSAACGILNTPTDALLASSSTAAAAAALGCADGLPGLLAGSGSPWIAQAMPLSGPAGSGSAPMADGCAEVLPGATGVLEEPRTGAPSEHAPAGLLVWACSSWEPARVAAGVALRACGAGSCPDNEAVSFVRLQTVLVTVS